MTVCCQCGKQIPDGTPRPMYNIKAVGRLIHPKPRCDSCRAEYEKTRTGLQKVKN